MPPPPFIVDLIVCSLYSSSDKKAKIYGLGNSPIGKLMKFATKYSARDFETYFFVFKKFLDLDILYMEDGGCGQNSNNFGEITENALDFIFFQWFSCIFADFSCFFLPSHLYI